MTVGKMIGRVLVSVDFSLHLCVFSLSAPRCTHQEGERAIFGQMREGDAVFRATPVISNLNHLGDLGKLHWNHKSVSTLAPERRKVLLCLQTSK